MPPAPPPSARAAAVRIVGRWLRAGVFPDRLLDDDDVPARAFVTEVVYGVARRRRTLEWLTGRCAHAAPDAHVLPYLLVGLYQLFFMDAVADYAAVNETVAALKASRRPHAAGFLNGVLREALRQRAALRARIAELPLAVRESHPDGLVARWHAAMGEARVEALCRWNNTRAAVAIRPNFRCTTLDGLAARLREGGVEARPHPFAPAEFLVLPPGCRVLTLPGLAEGWFSVQDPATAAAVRLLDVAPGQRVLDACAAPGGKTLLIAEALGGAGRVVAADVQEDRLALLRANVARLRAPGVDIVRADVSDAAAVTSLGGPFDRILLDVPCSNTGVLRRRPDARWRFSTARLEEWNRRQRVMLDHVSGLLRPGGRLVYSTCSLEPEEDETLVADWLAAHPAFRLRASVRLFPPETQTDGAYAAAIA